jgi:uncharacterized membrane protein
VSEQGQPRPQRIGDAERDSAAALLREHMAQGRLTAEEFDERIEAALTAKVASDLDPLFTDLPGPGPGQAVATTSSYETPPWQTRTTPAHDPLPAPAVLPPRSGGAEALRGVTGVLWIVVPLFISFVLNWADYWWLIFLPMIVSMVLGKSESERDRERKRIAREQEQLDQRRRAIGD